MKNAQQQQAKNLYFQTNLNKSQIAETLGVNRRTVMLWVQQGNWDRLKLSSQHLPSMVVEKCYYMLNYYLDNLLSANATISTFGTKEASAINQLATAIKKISNRSAVNESMELLSFFLEDVRRKDPSMAEAIMPFAEQYVATRKDVNLTDFLPQGFNDQGFFDPNEDDITEQILDEDEQELIDQDFAAWKAQKAAAVASSMSNIPTSDKRDDLSSSANLADLPQTPYTPTTGNAQNLPGINDHKTSSQARKLTAALEKQLTEYLKKQTTQNKAVA